MKRTTTTWSVTVPKPLAARVENFVRRQKRTKSELVSEALRQYLVLWGGVDIGERKKPVKVPKGQEWIWTKEWQAKIRESLEDLRQGRYEIFENAEDLLRDLHS